MDGKLDNGWRKIIYTNSMSKENLLEMQEEILISMMTKFLFYNPTQNKIGQ